MKNILIIMGSSRSNGNSAKMVAPMLADIQSNKKNNVELIDLLQQDISHYDYDHRNENDDFLSMATKMTQADIIIFVTPIYWYSMSAMLKMFFDRFTDLITIRKDLGRKLAGRECYVAACGSDIKLCDGFEIPFKATCQYLKMEYKGVFYKSCLGDDVDYDDILPFSRKILEDK